MTLEEVFYLDGYSKEKEKCLSTVEEIIKDYLCAGSKKEMRKEVSKLGKLLNMPKIDIKIVEDEKIIYGYIGLPKGQYFLAVMYEEQEKIAKPKLRLAR